MAVDPTSPVFGDSDGDRARVPAEYSAGRRAEADLVVLATVEDGDVAKPAGTTERPLSVVLFAQAGMGNAVTSPADVFDVTLSLDTAAYADGDVMADFQEVANFFPVVGGRALIQSVTVLDKDDRGLPFDILTSRVANSLGTENQPPSISDTNAENVQLLTRVLTDDYVDLGGCRVATRAGSGLIAEAAPDSRSLWIGTILRGAGTYTAAGVRLRIGVVYLG